MRSDDDKRTDKMTEIDDFLSQFESPSDNFTTDIDSYLDATSDARYTAAKTFHGRSNDQTMSKIQEGAKDSAAGKAEKVASTKDKSDKKAEKSSRLGRKGKKDKKSNSKSNKKFKYSNMSLDLKGLTLQSI
jgi:chromatin remodeling complex protein RSC6